MCEHLCPTPIPTPNFYAAKSFSKVWRGAQKLGKGCKTVYVIDYVVAFQWTLLNVFFFILADKSLPEMFEGQEQMSTGSRLASHSFNDQDDDVSTFLLRHTGQFI